MLLFDRCDGIATEWQAHRRIGSVSEGDQCLCQFLRITGLVMAETGRYRAYLADSLCIVADDVAADRQRRAVEKIRAEISRLDDGDMDAKWREFVMQCFA